MWNHDVNARGYRTYHQRRRNDGNRGHYNDNWNRRPQRVKTNNHNSKTGSKKDQKKHSKDQLSPKTQENKSQKHQLGESKGKEIHKKKSNDKPISNEEN